MLSWVCRLVVYAGEREALHRHVAIDSLKQRQLLRRAARVSAVTLKMRTGKKEPNEYRHPVRLASAHRLDGQAHRACGLTGGFVSPLGLQLAELLHEAP